MGLFVQGYTSVFKGLCCLVLLQVIRESSLRVLSSAFKQLYVILGKALAKV
jgi:hypothetical protein